MPHQRDVSIKNPTIKSHWQRLGRLTEVSLVFQRYPSHAGLPGLDNKVAEACHRSKEEDGNEEFQEADNELETK